jgi:hypothetical protein
MKVLFVLLAISVSAIVLTLAAMWLRLRWHLRKPSPPSETQILHQQKTASKAP